MQQARTATFLSLWAAVSSAGSYNMSEYKLKDLIHTLHPSLWFILKALSLCVTSWHSLSQSNEESWLLERKATNEFFFPNFGAI